MPKQFLPNQHVPLHFIYGPADCCLCNSQSAQNLLKEDLKYLLQFVDEDFVPSSELEYFQSRMKLIKDRIK